MGCMGDCIRLLCYLYLNKFIAPTVATIIPNANPIPIAEEYFWIHYLHDKDSTILYNNYIHKKCEVYISHIHRFLRIFKLTICVTSSINEMEV